jgi:protein subunit release factor A
MPDSNRKPLVTVTAADLRWDYYNGSGKGGQNRNKRQNCVRVFHDPSGAQAKSEDHRDLLQNRKAAFVRLTQTKEFKEWITIATMRASGELAQIAERVEREMSEENLRVEVKNQDGRWVDERTVAKSED